MTRSFYTPSALAQRAEPARANNGTVPHLAGTSFQSARGNLALLRHIACRELRTLPLRFPAGVIFQPINQARGYDADRFETMPAVVIGGV